MTIEQTIEIPTSHRLVLEVPWEIPAGKTILAFTPVNNAPKGAVKNPARIGFLKGQIAVPADFDTMGREEITALFEGNT